MSSQGLIVILLSAVGFLVVSWVGIASVLIKERFSDHEEEIAKHDTRIQALEISRIKEEKDREEMLNILRILKNVS